MKGKFRPLDGQIFSRLEVLGLHDKKTPKGDLLWRCRCICGKETLVKGWNLTSGGTKSCGCLRSGVVSELMTKHKRRRTPEYSSWRGMIQRCNNPKANHYDSYGGRGIVVCLRWQNDFRNFLEDMGPRPRGHTLERRNNNGDYCPENCIWAPRSVQSRNRRSCRLITINNVTKCATDWAHQFGIKPKLVHNRLSRGWPPQEAVMGRPKP